MVRVYDFPRPIYEKCKNLSFLRMEERTLNSEVVDLRRNLGRYGGRKNKGITHVRYLTPPSIFIAFSHKAYLFLHSSSENMFRTMKTFTGFDIFLPCGILLSLSHRKSHKCDFLIRYLSFIFYLRELYPRR